MKISKSLLRPLICVLTLATLLPAAHLQAAERYVSDELLVPLRSGAGGNYRIVHRGLPSGTKLELLEESEDDSGNIWARVQTEQGLEGWIRGQYLLTEPTAARKLETLTRRMSQLDGDQSQLLENNEQLEAANAELTQQLASLQQAHETLNAEHANLQQLSANTVALSEQHKQLSQNYQLLQTRAEVLNTENERLASSQRFREWIFGAVLLFCGVILSLILQSLGKRKRQSEWR